MGRGFFVAIGTIAPHCSTIFLNRWGCGAGVGWDAVFFMAIETIAPHIYSNAYMLNRLYSVAVGKWLPESDDVVFGIFDLSVDSHAGDFHRPDYQRTSGLLDLFDALSTRRHFDHNHR